MHVTYNKERVLVQMTIQRTGKGVEPHVAVIVPEVTLEAMQKVADTLLVRAAPFVDRVEVHPEQVAQGFYNFYVYPGHGEEFLDDAAQKIGGYIEQAWKAAGLPVA